MSQSLSLPAARPGASVAITVTGHDAAVDARHAELAAEPLKRNCIEWAAADGSVIGVPFSQPLGSISGDKFVFPAKLALFVSAHLTGRGIASTVHGLSAPPAPNWKAAPPVLRELIGGAAQAGLGGIVCGPRSVEAGTLIPALLRLYPTVRAAVAVSTRDAAAFWRRHLERSDIGRPIAKADAEPGWRNSPDVHVITHQKLELCKPDDIGFVVALGVRHFLARSLVATRFQVGAERRWLTYPLLRDCRVPAFGFLEDGTKMMVVEELHLRSWFCRFLLPKEPTLRVRVSVAPGPQPAGALPTDVRAAKRAVWACAQRNAHTARLAWLAANEPDAHVAVLVGSADHASAVDRRLNGWKRVTGAFRGPLYNRSVVTEAWLAGGGRFQRGTIIDARGWGPLLPTDFVAGADVTVTDVPADGHPEFRTRTAERLRAYADRGWTVEPVTANHTDHR